MKFISLFLSFEANPLWLNHLVHLVPLPLLHLKDCLRIHFLNYHSQLMTKVLNLELFLAFNICHLILHLPQIMGHFLILAQNIRITLSRIPRVIRPLTVSLDWLFILLILCSTLLWYHCSVHVVSTISRVFLWNYPLEHLRSVIVACFHPWNPKANF